MPESAVDFDFVINTGPVISLAAAVGSLNFLENLYSRILVPLEVYQELQAGGADCHELRCMKASKVFVVSDKCVELPVLLKSQLDKGEASVIQNAVINKVPVVAIDEKIGRRVARLHELGVTGSIGILIKGAKSNLIPDLRSCFVRMHDNGIWISQDLQNQALEAAKSGP